MQICVEERDWSNSQGDGQSTGWTHYFEYPSLKKIKDVYHNDGTNSNDSGDSTFLGNIQYQINCYCHAGGAGDSGLYIKEADTNKLIEGISLVDSSGYILRCLGISHLGNKFYIGAMAFENPAYINKGLYTWEKDAGTVAKFIKGYTVEKQFNGIDIVGNLLFHCSEDDDNLRILNLDTLNLVAEIAMATPNDNHYRGCAVHGNTIVVGQCGDTVYNVIFYEYNNLEIIKIKDWDMGQFKHNGNNVMPYGVFFYPNPNI